MTFLTVSSQKTQNLNNTIIGYTTLPGPLVPGLTSRYWTVDQFLHGPMKLAEYRKNQKLTVHTGSVSPGRKR